MSDLGLDAVAELAGPAAQVRDLYYLWERERWEAGAIDLASDGADRDALEPGLLGEVTRLVSTGAHRARTAVSGLVSLVDSAPTEEQQVFLTTELVDEARHLVFYDRVRAEVLDDLDVDDAPRSDPVERALQPVPGRGFAARVVAYQLAVVGLGALVETRSVADRLRDRMPGLKAGLDLVARDLRRHAAFGLRVAREAAASRPSCAAELIGVLDDLGSEVEHRLSPEERSRARDARASWLQLAGLETPG